MPRAANEPPPAGHYDNRADMCGYGIMIQRVLTGVYRVVGIGMDELVTEVGHTKHTHTPDSAPVKHHVLLQHVPWHSWL